MALTGLADGPPVLGPAWLATFMDRTIEAFEAEVGRSLHLDGARLLGERAACEGLTRRGTISPGGSCRLLRASDNWIAINLSRPDDRRLLPAWLGEGDTTDPWAFIVERIPQMTAAEAVARARLLGLAAAVSPPMPRVAPAEPLEIEQRSSRGPRLDSRPPLVVDLSSLWAGPLCTHLLGMAGARVIKVESVRRPDGARHGSARFYDLLNAGKETVALDFTLSRHVAKLMRLIQRADIVVESSRPRALRQLGIDADAVIAESPGLTWLSITGYGRNGEPGNWIAFGDDAGVAAGLAEVAGEGHPTPLFCGDAIADPLTGAQAALSAWRSWRGGGSRLLDLALADVSARAMASGSIDDDARVVRSEGIWHVEVAGLRQPVASPTARRASGRARELGADTDSVLRELAD
jgi:hypothetical protein